MMHLTRLPRRPAHPPYGAPVGPPQRRLVRRPPPV